MLKLNSSFNSSFKFQVSIQVSSFNFQLSTFESEMSIANENLPLPHRGLLKKNPPLPRRHRDGIKNTIDNLLFLVVRKYVL